MNTSLSPTNCKSCYFHIRQLRCIRCCERFSIISHTYLNSLQLQGARALALARMSDLDIDRCISVTSSVPVTQTDVCLSIKRLVSSRHQLDWPMREQLPSTEYHASVEITSVIATSACSCQLKLNSWTFYLNWRTARKSWEEFAADAPLRHQLLLAQVTEQRSGVTSERRWLRPSVNIAVAIVCRRRHRRHDFDLALVSCRRVYCPESVKSASLPLALPRCWLY